MARVDTIRGGSLRHLVTLQRAVTASDGQGGQEVMSWDGIATVWADIWPLSGRDRLQAEQVQSTVLHRALIRFQASPSNPDLPFVAAKDRLIHKGLAHNIRAVLDLEGRHQFLELDLESGVAA